MWHNLIMPHTLKIASWNVNSVRTRLPHVLAWLDAHQPDALLLQETKVENHLFPAADFINRGYYLAVHGQKSYNGVAILSKYPLADVVAGFNGTDMVGQPRILSATLHHPAGNLRLINAYVVNGEDVDSPKFAFKKQFYEALTDFIKNQTISYPHTLLMGDFNVAADERDVDDVRKRSGKVLFTDAERTWLNTLLTQSDIHDALRLLNQAPAQFTWWDYRAGAFEQNRGMRIDYGYVSTLLKPHVSTVQHHTAEREKPQPSDHIPVAVELTFSETM
jgi:exodeoxyribonuclease III